MADFTIDTGMVDGKTIAEWTQDWWKWSLNLTDGQNPFTHPNGNFTDVNNDGSVFFIAGVSQKHPFDVPHGPLLVPLVNFVDTAPETPPMEQTETNNLAMFDSSVDVQSLFAKIDGVAVSDLAYASCRFGLFRSRGSAEAHTCDRFLWSGSSRRQYGTSQIGRLLVDDRQSGARPPYTGVWRRS